MLVGKKIIVIDDEVDFGLLLKRHLSKKGHEVYVAYDLKTGLPMIEKLSPEVIFIDNNLPDGLGWDFAEEIAFKHPNAKLFLITAFNSKISLAKNKSILQSDSKFKIMEKPLRLDQLEEFVDEDKTNQISS